MEKDLIYHVEIHNFTPPDGDPESKESQESFYFRIRQRSRTGLNEENSSVGRSPELELFQKLLQIKTQLSFIIISSNYFGLWTVFASGG